MNIPGYRRVESHPFTRHHSLNSSRISYFVESDSERIISPSRQQSHLKSSNLNDIAYSNIGNEYPLSLIPSNIHLFDQYISFCPKIIYKLIQAKKIFLNGCCLLADISGFTKLSSNLCKEGPDGIDTLRIVINHSFASFVDIIHQYGGDGKILFFI